ncbi:MAG: agmatine deiminase [Lachnospiraceae bacterium]|nr:agmatine deiminase [Lachnospiraceae bacterium]
MKILHSTPTKDGYFMPAEYEHHTGCFMIWPERADSWQYGAVYARKAFADVAHAIAKSEKVTVFTSFEGYDTARKMLKDHIRVVEMSSDDSWARDVMPTFVKNSDGTIRGIDWGFNAWGGLYDGLYFPWDRDNRMARKVCDLLEVDVYDKRSFVMEGGAFHVDGQGTAIVTEACLLSKGRNPHMTKQDIEMELKQTLGVTHVIWLPCGIYEDETNEHVDNICTYAEPGHVILAWTDDREDPQYEMSRRCLEVLEHETDARGRSIRVTKLPMPAPVYVTEDECSGLIDFDGEPTRKAGDRLAASYVNFYISNGAIVMPRFNDENDDKAADILRNIFKNREIIQIDARNILIGGGNIHCITQQIPGGR